MKVVSNAGPLMALGKLGLVHLLHQLYGPVMIPVAVYDEVVTRGLELGLPDAYVIQLAIARRELVIVQMDTADMSQAIQALSIGEGEKQAIQLGMTEAADLVLLDDLLAREEAQRLELKIKGTLGIIVHAYHQGLITSREIEITFRAILEREDIWISESLVRRVRDAVLK